MVCWKLHAKKLGDATAELCVIATKHQKLNKSDSSACTSATNTEEAATSSRMSKLMNIN